MDQVPHFQVIGLANVDLDHLKAQLQNEENEIDIINKHMDYRLKIVDKTTKVPKEAINIARIMGLDEQIIHRAEKNLEE